MGSTGASPESLDAKNVGVRSDSVPRQSAAAETDGNETNVPEEGREAEILEVPVCDV